MNVQALTALVSSVGALIGAAVAVYRNIQHVRTYHTPPAAQATPGVPPSTAGTK